MQAHSFEAILKPDHTVSVPDELAAKIPPGKMVRILVLVPESEEDEDWRRLTESQFLKGYADSDALYDQLSGG